MKKEKGITIIALVITIIILSILASIATYSGVTVIQTSKLTAFTTELKIMQTQVNAMYEENNEKDDYGKTIIEGSETGKQAEKVFSTSESGITNKDGYKYWDNDTIRELGIEGVENTFFVNLEKRSIVSYEGLEYEGKRYYTLSQLPDGMYNVEYNAPDEKEKPNFNVKYEYIGTNRWKIDIFIQYNGYIDKWQVNYKLIENENWNTSEDLSFVVGQTGTYKIRIQNGSVQSEEQEIEIRNITKAIDIVSEPSKYYGSIVTGYECENSKAVENWKIFYADNNNIYLIADDYIASNYAPKGKGGSSINTNGMYQMYFENILNDYEGASDITMSSIKALNNDYFNIKGYSTTNESMKAVAYMLDSNVWSGFKGDKASYAIAGPTIELLMKSYSQKYNVDYRAQANDIAGYQISKDAGVSWENSYDEILDTEDTLYVVKNTDKAISMWIASPSRLETANIISVYHNGNVGIKGYSADTVGFRPLVCLKSNVELEEQEDGTYKIVD